MTGVYSAILAKTRGVIPVIVLYVLGAAALTQLVPDWRLPNLFAKKPPTIELAKAEQALATAKADAAESEAKLKAAQAVEQAKIAALLGGSQQMLQGVNLALKRAPASPEVTLAMGLADRASLGLKSAIGDLPADRQAEILAIVDGALSAKQAEVDAANAKLAAKDAELKQVTADKLLIQAKIPQFEVAVEKAKTAQTAAEGTVAAKTAEIVTYAEKMAAKEKEAGSLAAFGQNILKLLALVAVVALGLLCGLAYLKFHSVGIAGLASVVKDIKAGVDPIHALDTVTSPRIQAKVSDLVNP